MNPQNGIKISGNVAESAHETENPIQARHLREVAESLEETAETVFMERRLEVQNEAGSGFVP